MSQVMPDKSHLGLLHYCETEGSLRQHSLLEDERGSSLFSWHSTSLIGPRDYLNCISKHPKNNQSINNVADEGSQLLGSSGRGNEKAQPAHFSAWNTGMLPQTWADLPISINDNEAIPDSGKPLGVIDVSALGVQTGEVYEVKVLTAFKVVSSLQMLPWTLVVINADDAKAGRVYNSASLEKQMPGTIGAIKERLSEATTFDSAGAGEKGPLEGVVIEEATDLGFVDTIIGDAHASWNSFFGHLATPQWNNVPCAPLHASVDLRPLQSAHAEEAAAQEQEQQQPPLSGRGRKREKATTPGEEAAPAAATAAHKLLRFVQAKVKSPRPSSSRRGGISFKAAPALLMRQVRCAGEFLFSPSSDDNSDGDNGAGGAREKDTSLRRAKLRGPYSRAWEEGDRAQAAGRSLQAPTSVRAPLTPVPAPASTVLPLAQSIASGYSSWPHRSDYSNGQDRRPAQEEAFSLSTAGSGNRARGVATGEAQGSEAQPQPQPQPQPPRLQRALTADIASLWLESRKHMRWRGLSRARRGAGLATLSADEQASFYGGPANHAWQSGRRELSGTGVAGDAGSGGAGGHGRRLRIFESSWAPEVASSPSSSAAGAAGGLARSSSCRDRGRTGTEAAMELGQVAAATPSGVARDNPGQMEGCGQAGEQQSGESVTARGSHRGGEVEESKARSPQGLPAQRGAGAGSAGKVIAAGEAPGGNNVLQELLGVVNSLGGGSPTSADMARGIGPEPRPGPGTAVAGAEPREAGEATGADMTAWGGAHTHSLSHWLDSRDAQESPPILTPASPDKVTATDAQPEEGPPGVVPGVTMELAARRPGDGGSLGRDGAGSGGEGQRLQQGTLQQEGTLTSGAACMPMLPQAPLSSKESAVRQVAPAQAPAQAQAPTPTLAQAQVEAQVALHLPQPLSENGATRRATEAAPLPGGVAPEPNAKPKPGVASIMRMRAPSAGTGARAGRRVTFRDSVVIISFSSSDNGSSSSSDGCQTPLPGAAPPRSSAHVADALAKATVREGTTWLDKGRHRWPQLPVRRTDDLVLEEERGRSQSGPGVKLTHTSSGGRQAAAVAAAANLYPPPPPPPAAAAAATGTVAAASPAALNDAAAVAEQETRDQQCKPWLEGVGNGSAAHAVMHAHAQAKAQVQVQVQTQAENKWRAKVPERLALALASKPVMEWPPGSAPLQGAAIASTSRHAWHPGGPETASHFVSAAGARSSGEKQQQLSRQVSGSGSSMEKLHQLTRQMSGSRAHVEYSRKPAPLHGAFASKDQSADDFVPIAVPVPCPLHAARLQRV